MISNKIPVSDSNMAQLAMFLLHLNKLDSAVALVQNLMEAGSTPGLHTFAVLLEGYHKAGRRDDFNAAVAAMRRLHLQLDQPVYRLLMRNAVTRREGLEIYKQALSENLWAWPSKNIPKRMDLRGMSRQQAIVHMILHIDMLHELSQGTHSCT